MLALLINFISCSALTSDNFTLFMSEMKHAPVFVALVSQWCPHCKKLKANWDKLEQNYENSSKVVVATVSCDEEQRLCNKFPDYLTPSFYWVRKTPEEAEHYTGSTDLTELIAYIEKQIAPSIIRIKDQDQYDKEIEKHRNNSIFIMQSLHQDKPIKKLEEVVSKFEMYPCFFFILEFPKYDEESFVFLHMFVPINQQIPYQNKISRSKLSNFISHYAYPAISTVSQAFIEHAKETGDTVLILVDEYPFFEEQLIKMIIHLPSNIRCGVMSCGNNPKSCMHLSIVSGKGPQILLYNPRKRYIWHYRQPLNQSTIILWTTKVMYGQVRPEGPGAGFIGFIGSLVANTRAKGNFAFACVVAIMVVFVFIFVFAIVDTIRKKEKSLYHKLN